MAGAPHPTRAAASRDPRAAPEPRVAAVLGHGWYTLRTGFWRLIGLMAVVVAVSLAVQLPFSVAEAFSPTQLGALIATIIVSYLIIFAVELPLSAGTAWTFLRAARGESPSASDLFAGFRRYVPVLLAMLAVFALVVAGLALLIVPGLLVAVRLFMVPYLILDEQMGPRDALRTSWSTTRGHTWTLLGLAGLSVLITLAGLLALIVGVVVAAAWVAAAQAAMYRALREPGPR